MTRRASIGMGMKQAWRAEDTPGPRKRPGLLGRGKSFAGALLEQALGVELNIDRVHRIGAGELITKLLHTSQDLRLRQGTAAHRLQHGFAKRELIASAFAAAPSAATPCHSSGTGNAGDGCATSRLAAGPRAGQTVEDTEGFIDAGNAFDQGFLLAQ